MPHKKNLSESREASNVTRNQALFLGGALLRAVRREQETLKGAINNEAKKEKNPQSFDRFSSDRDDRRVFPA